MSHQPCFILLSQVPSTMSGLDDLISESNERWTEAERRSQDIIDRGMGEAARRFQAAVTPGG